MINFSKIVVLFFALLISSINSGLLIRNPTLQSLNNSVESFPSSDRFSIQNIFLCPISEIIFKNNLVPTKTEKFLQKIKNSWSLRAGTLVNKNHQYPLKSDNQDPTLIADIFGPPDISFPFNYFW